MSAGSKVRSGSPLYVPTSERGAAMSLGAALVEGDARLHVPSPLPRGVELEAFERWVSPTAKIRWMSEFLEDIVGTEVDVNDVAGLIVGGDLGSDDDDEALVPLFVPRREMEIACMIPGVSWDRRRRLYVADRTAQFGLVYRYLTPAMRSVWLAERNMDTAMRTLMRARAVLAEVEEGGEHQMEREPGDHSDRNGVGEDD